MDLLTGYDASATRLARAALLAHGALAPVDERGRWTRRPHRSVFFDERGRTGPQRGGAGRDAGTYQAGLFGEEVVADGLRADGWRILGHRVRTKVGELDLVARRGDVVAFIEVKTAGPGRVAVEQSVDQRAQHRIRRAAVAWMACNPRLQRGVRSYRFDVYLVHRDRDGGIHRIDRIRDAF